MGPRFQTEVDKGKLLNLPVNFARHLAVICDILFYRTKYKLNKYTNKCVFLVR